MPETQDVFMCVDTWSNTVYNYYYVLWLGSVLLLPKLMQHIPLSSSFNDRYDTRVTITVPVCTRIDENINIAWIVYILSQVMPLSSAVNQSWWRDVNTGHTIITVTVCGTALLSFFFSFPANIQSYQACCSCKLWVWLKTRGKKYSGTSIIWTPEMRPP